MFGKDLSSSSIKQSPRKIVLVAKVYLTSLFSTVFVTHLALQLMLVHVSFTIKHKKQQNTSKQHVQLDLKKQLKRIKVVDSVEMPGSTLLHLEAFLLAILTGKESKSI